MVAPFPSRLPTISNLSPMLSPHIKWTDNRLYQKEIFRYTAKFSYTGWSRAYTSRSTANFRMIRARIRGTALGSGRSLLTHAQHYRPSISETRSYLIPRSPTNDNEEHFFPRLTLIPSPRPRLRPPQPHPPRLPQPLTHPYRKP